MIKEKNKKEQLAEIVKYSKRDTKLFIISAGDLR